MWKAFVVLFCLCVSHEDVLAETRVKSPIPAGKSQPDDVIVLDQKDLTLKPTVGSNISCKVIHSHSVPTSVHRLRPSDIRVVAAMGDSITAAFGARSPTILTGFLEYRGISWSIGGDKTLTEVETLPNILKHFNPNIVGFSTGIGMRFCKTAHLNVAKTGDLSKNLDAQIDLLIKRMKGNPAIDFESDWKLITLWIGANDQCEWCKNDSQTETEQEYIQNVRNALNRVRDSIPRVFVNLVQIIDVTVLYPVKTGMCDILHAIQCPCGAGRTASTRERTKLLAAKFQRDLRSLANEYVDSENDEFTVVLQPFFENYTVPKTASGEPDRSLFGADCFHFSPKAHAASASSLWNNMMSPVGKKVTGLAASGPLRCPTEESPFLATAKNSKMTHTNGRHSQRRQSRPILTRTHTERGMNSQRHRVDPSHAL